MADTPRRTYGRADVERLSRWGQRRVLAALRLEMLVGWLMVAVSLG